MNNYLIIFSLLYLFTNCEPEVKSSDENKEASEQTILQEPMEVETEVNVESNISDYEIPKLENYQFLDSTIGDLDNDGVEELVVGYNTKEINDSNLFEGVPRELIIYKNNGREWGEWIKSGQALMGSQDGGMMGDPYDGMEIKKGILIINHWGGSSWKWNVTDKYRFQEGQFYLIGYTSNYGRPCDYWEDTDFNLSTGKVIYSVTTDDCEDENYDPEPVEEKNEEFYYKGLKVTLQNRHEREIEIKSPEGDVTIYL